MQIIINQTPAEAFAGETLIETARRAGHDIPSLCYAKGAKHKSSCMVCVVKDCVTGQIIPSCTTLPTEGMCIDTENEEVRTIRTLSLELLLSDHRADCEAPCSMVCPQGLDIEQMLNLYDTGKFKEAHLLIAGVFALPALGCDTCKAPCEKVCRRGSVDQAVPIRAIIREIVSSFKFQVSSLPSVRASPFKFQVSSFKFQVSNVETSLVLHEVQANLKLFQSRLGRFTEKEKLEFQVSSFKFQSTKPKTGNLNGVPITEGKLETINLNGEALTEGKPETNCLHCACAGREGCKLRLYATAAGIKRPRYEMSSALPVMKKVHVTGRMWFEPAKCIRCGLCVYNSNNGFTFKDRGFGMQVVIPDESRENVGEDLADLCPTGAMYLI